MDDKIIDGKLISSVIKEEIKSETAKLKSEKNIIPGLAFILVGDDPASKVYVNSKGKACEELGFHSITEKLSSQTSESELLNLIQQF